MPMSLKNIFFLIIFAAGLQALSYAQSAPGFGRVGGDPVASPYQHVEVAINREYLDALAALKRENDEQKNLITLLEAKIKILEDKIRLLEPKLPKTPQPVESHDNARKNK